MRGLVGPSVGPAKREEQVPSPWEVGVDHKLPGLHHLVLDPVLDPPPPQSHRPLDGPEAHIRLDLPALVKGIRPGTDLEVGVAGRDGVIDNLEKKS